MIPEQNFNGINPDELFDSGELLCEYCSLDSFLDLIDSSRELNLGFFNLNIRSFHKNSYHLHAILHSPKNPPNFILLTETWNSSENIEQCFLEKYKGVHTFRDFSRGGGVSVFCSDKFIINKIESLSLCNKDIETCTAIISRDSCSLVIVGVYRPPSGSVDDFLNSLEDIVSDPIIRGKLVLLSGDFNLNLMNLDNIGVRNYLSLLNNYQFIQTINKPTRFPADYPTSSPSALDHISMNKILPFRSGIIESDISDHCPNFLFFKYSLFSPQNTITKIKFSLRRWLWSFG